MELLPSEAERPRRSEVHALWRLTGWGLAAALALGVLAVTTQTYTGSERLKLALAPAAMPAHTVTVVKIPPAPPADAEITRLQAQVRALAADRDRLATRIAGLERNLDDLTGSIKQLSAPPPAAAAQPAARAAAPAAATGPAPKAAATAAAEPPPQPAAPETIAAPATAPLDIDRSEARAAEKAPTPPPPAPPQPTSGAPAPAAVPLPPVRMAALPPKPEFGIALAGASNMALLHMQWAAIKANFGPLIGDLKPYALHERRGTASHYRLIIGSMPTYTAAARLCARLIAARAVCHPVKMAGEPL